MKQPVGRVHPKLRQHLNRDGTEKRKLGPVAAKLAAEHNGQDPYLCPLCGFWHVGTSSWKRTS
jgi:hypothetical protein